MRRHEDLVPAGHSLAGVTTFNDQWSFAAAGVPGIYVRSCTDEFRMRWEHTDFDCAALQDVAAMAAVVKLVHHVMERVDGGVLPYDIAARAGELMRSIDPVALRAAGPAIAWWTGCMTAC